MGRAFSTHKGEEERIQGFGGKARKKETTRKTETSVAYISKSHFLLLNIKGGNYYFTVMTVVIMHTTCISIRLTLHFPHSVFMCFV
jgi:hypothetical protein